MDDKDPFYGWRFLVWFIIGCFTGVFILKAILG